MFSGIWNYLHYLEAAGRIQGFIKVATETVDDMGVVVALMPLPFDLAGKGLVHGLRWACDIPRHQPHIFGSSSPTQCGGRCPRGHRPAVVAGMELVGVIIIVTLGCQGFSSCWSCIDRNRMHFLWSCRFVGRTWSTPQFPRGDVSLPRSTLSLRSTVKTVLPFSVSGRQAG